MIRTVGANCTAQSEDVVFCRDGLMTPVIAIDNHIIITKKCVEIAIDKKNMTLL